MFLNSMHLQFTIFLFLFIGCSFSKKRKKQNNETEVSKHLLDIHAPGIPNWVKKSILDKGNTPFPEKIPNSQCHWEESKSNDTSLFCTLVIQGAENKEFAQEIARNSTRNKIHDEFRKIVDLYPWGKFELENNIEADPFKVFALLELDLVQATEPYELFTDNNLTHGVRLKLTLAKLFNVLKENAFLSNTEKSFLINEFDSVYKIYQASN